MHKPPCEDCKKLHASNEAPCSTCEVVLLPENREIVSVYLMVQDQLLPETKTISLSAIVAALSIMNIVEDKALFVEKIKLLHQKVGQRT